MPHEIPKVLENSLLIADPSLRDGVFDRTVIHISEHSKKDGAVGYILNKPTDKKVGDVLTDGVFSGLKNVPVYFGGPVGTDHIVFSVYWWDEEKNFCCHLRISAEEAVRIKRRPGSLLIAHVGHSSWHEGQLEDELSEKAWVSARISENTLSVNHSALWKTLLEELSPFHRLMALTPLKVEEN